MKNTVHIIVFSFNRAMQCESVLRSIQEHVKGTTVRISVVWHATGPHRDGYARLCDLYQGQDVALWERAGRPSFLKDVLPRLARPRNLYHWLKHDYVRSMDNFQPLVESLIENTEADLVSFNTDDNIYYRDELLPQAAFDRISRDPRGASYWVRVGANVRNCLPLEPEDGLLTWDRYDPAMVKHKHWAYPFSVDGCFYGKHGLLSFLRRLVYHNPVTLEAFGVGLARHLRCFRVGLSPQVSSMVALPLNKVDFTVSKNRRGDVSVDRLNALFLDGYSLEYEIPTPLDVSGLIPHRVYACRGDERVQIEVRAEE